MKAGDTFAGRYLWHEAMAVAHGEAFRAEDTRTRRQVRVRLWKAGQADPAKLRRYAEVLADANAITHVGAGVPRVQVNLTGSPCFVVGDLPPGEDLAAVLAREGRLGWERALAVIQGCAEALAALEKVGPHRALRPESVWLAKEGAVVVLDFGVGEVVPAAVVERGPQDFVEYRAPEQVAGEPGDLRSDVFSLGVILMEMLTGTHPFAGTTAFKVAHRMLSQAAPRATALAPEVPVPSEVEALLGRMLAREPGARLAAASLVVSHVALVRRSPGFAPRQVAASAAARGPVPKDPGESFEEPKDELTTSIAIPIPHVPKKREPDARPEEPPIPAPDQNNEDREPPIFGSGSEAQPVHRASPQRSTPQPTEQTIADKIAPDMVATPLFSRTPARETGTEVFEVRPAGAAAERTEVLRPPVERTVAVAASPSFEEARTVTLDLGKRRVAGAPAPPEKTEVLPQAFESATLHLAPRVQEGTLDLRRPGEDEEPPVGPARAAGGEASEHVRPARTSEVSIVHAILLLCILCMALLLVGVILLLR